MLDKIANVYYNRIKVNGIAGMASSVAVLVYCTVSPFSSKDRWVLKR